MLAPLLFQGVYFWTSLVFNFYKWYSCQATYFSLYVILMTWP